MLGYWAMYFKVYHPAVFYAASLRKTDKAKWANLMRDMLDPKFAGLRVGGDRLTVGAIDINKSSITWTVDQERGIILPGFAQIPGIGVKMGAEIAVERKMARDMGQTWDWTAIGTIKGIGPKKLEVLREWATKDDPFGVTSLHISLEEIRMMLRAGQLIDGGGAMLPAPSHKSEDLPFDMGVQFYDEHGNAMWGNEERLPVTWIGRVKERNLRDMFEEYRTREGSDLDPASIRHPEKKLSMIMYAYDDTDEINLRVSRYKFDQFKDTLMKIRLDHDVVVVDGYKTRSFGRKVEINRMWLIDPD
jgi:hypothetical protein